MYDMELRQSRGYYRGVIPARPDSRRTPPLPAEGDTRTQPPSVNDTLLGASIDPPPPPMPRDLVRQMGYTGSQCSNCSSVRMKVSGHCEVCEECGTTTGCS